MDSEWEILQRIRFQITVISESSYGLVDASFQCIIAFAKSDTNADTKVFFLVDLRADKFKSRAVFLAEKSEVSLHRVSHDHIGTTIDQIEKLFYGGFRSSYDQK